MPQRVKASPRDGSRASVRTAAKGAEVAPGAAFAVVVVVLPQAAHNVGPSIVRLLPAHRPPNVEHVLWVLPDRVAVHDAVAPVLHYAANSPTKDLWAVVLQDLWQYRFQWVHVQVLDTAAALASTEWHQSLGSISAATGRMRASAPVLACHRDFDDSGADVNGTWRHYEPALWRPVCSGSTAVISAGLVAIIVQRASAASLASTEAHYLAQLSGGASCRVFFFPLLQPALIVPATPFFSSSSCSSSSFFVLIIFFFSCFFTA